MLLASHRLYAGLTVNTVLENRDHSSHLEATATQPFPRGGSSSPVKREVAQ